MVPFSNSDCSKCTPFYVIFSPNWRKVPFSILLLKKAPLLAIFEQPAPCQKHPSFTRFCCRTCIPTSRPSDPPGYTRTNLCMHTHTLTHTNTTYREQVCRGSSLHAPSRQDSRTHTWRAGGGRPWDGHRTDSRSPWGRDTRHTTRRTPCTSIIVDIMLTWDTRRARLGEIVDIMLTWDTRRARLGGIVDIMLTWDTRRARLGEIVDIMLTHAAHV
jgi:hypothetical protein